MESQPSVLQLVKWLTSHTRDVHKPLYVSTLFRLVNLSMDIVLFALGAGGLVAVVAGNGKCATILFWLVVVALIKASAYYCEQFTGHYVAFKALELLRTMVFSRLWPKAPGIVLRSKSGDVLASLTRDVDRIEVVYAHTFAPVVSAIIVPPVFLIGAGIVWGWQIVAVPALCLLIALAVVPFLGARSSLEATKHTLELRRHLAQHVTDSVFGAEEVVGYGRVNERLEEMDAIGFRISSSASVAKRANALRRALNAALTLISTLAIAWSAMNAGYSPVIVAMATAGTLRLFEGPRGVEDATGYLDHSLSAARRLWEICHAPANVDDGDEELTLDHAPTLTFENVTYTYPSVSAPALKDVTISVKSGGHVVLAGPSGSGKSTVMTMVLRYDNPDSGRVLIDGIDVSTFTLDSLRHSVVAVSQKNQLLNTTIRDNVALGAPNASDEQVWRALECACVADEVRAMPQGLHTRVAQGGSALSGGQVQRLSLARALVMNPKILILDEATAQLNSELEARIRHNLDTLDMTIIEVTHRLDLIDGADQIVLLDRGRIVGVGSPSTIRSEGSSLEEFFTRNV